MRALSVLLLIGVCLLPGVSHAGTHAKPTLANAGTPAALHVESTGPNGLLHMYDKPASGSVFINWDLRCVRNCIRIDNDASDIQIVGSHFSSFGPTTGSNLPVGLDIVSGHDILVKDSVFDGFTMAPSAKYLEGDGVSGQRAAHDITFDGDHFLNNSDGCLDIKATNVTVVNGMWAENCHYGIRAWGPGWKVDTLYCTNITKACVQLASNTTTGTGQKVVIRGAAPKQIVFDAYPGSAWTQVACEVQDANGQPIYDGLDLIWVNYGNKSSKTNTNIVLGPSCSNTPPKPVVSVPPPVKGPIPVFSKTKLDDNDGDGVIVVGSTAGQLGVAKGTKLLKASETAVPGGFDYTVKP